MKVITLTPYLKSGIGTPKSKEDGILQLSFIVKKDLFDMIRKHDGEFLIFSSHYTLVSMDTNYIGYGTINFDLGINCVMRETMESIRNRKINEILN